MEGRLKEGGGRAGKKEMEIEEEEEDLRVTGRGREEGRKERRKERRRKVDL